MELVVSTMEKCEKEGMTIPLPHWQHLSSQLIYFVLFQFASFPHMVTQLYDEVGWLFEGKKDFLVDAVVEPETLQKSGSSHVGAAPVHLRKYTEESGEF